MHGHCRLRFPKELLDAPPNLSSPILRLPTELLLQVSSHAKNPTDRLCLALASKRLLQVAAVGKPILIPSVKAHRDPSANCGGAGPHCSEMFELMRRIKPLDAHGRPKKTVSLCCDCLRYRPLRKSYWKGDGKRYLAIGDADIYEDVVRQWTTKSSFQCPACYCDERLEIHRRCSERLAREEASREAWREHQLKVKEEQHRREELILAARRREEEARRLREEESRRLRDQERPLGDPSHDGPEATEAYILAEEARLQAEQVRLEAQLARVKEAQNRLQEQRLRLNQER